MRPLMEEAYRILADGGVPIVVAPTGYGKTMASPEIYERASRDGLASGLIHVAPLRSLVRKVYNDVFRDRGGGYQMHDPGGEGEGKSPYFLRSLVVTTLDSYLWNLYRIPVAEAAKIEDRVSMGHYYPISTGILTSINVFDEAHMYVDETLAPGASIIAVKTAIETLAGLNAWMIIETATLRPTTLARIAKGISDSVGKWGRRVYVVALPCQARMLSKSRELADSAGMVVVEDDEWVDGSKLDWMTSITSSWDPALEEAIRLSRDGPVLVVTNTVASAIGIYKKLAGKGVDGDNLILVHGRLSSRDRSIAEEKLGAMKHGIIVATQVAEAGVDVNSIAVITEAAPVENLIQRAGRACRRGESLDYCRSEGARIIVVDTGDYSVYPEEETIRALTLVASHARIDWRIPCGRPGYTGYATLVHEADTLSSGGIGNNGISMLTTTMDELLKAYLRQDGMPWALLEILDSYGACSLYRETAMIPVIVGQDEYVTVSLDWILSNASKLLARNPDGVPLIEVKAISGEGRAIHVRVEALNLWRRWHQSGSGGIKCSGLLEGLRRDLQEAAKRLNSKPALLQWSFIAAPGAYIKRLGLIGGGG